MSFKPALEFHNQTLDKLVSQIEQQKDLLSIVQSVLPVELANQIVCCVVHEETLFIYTTAAVWSSQLRFYQVAILNIVIKHEYEMIKRVQIRLTK